MKAIIRNLFFILLASACIASCKNAASAGREKVSGDTVLTGLERGPCFGQCPQYKAIIYTTGFAEFNGIRNYSRIGYHTARLSPEQIAAFKELMIKYHMADADSEYVNKRLADYPAYWLTVSDPKGSRRILVNHEAPPARISDFTTELESMIIMLPWVLTSRENDQ